MADATEAMAAEQRKLDLEDATGELRFAVSMNGGVSLAVWIGGTAGEILELVRGSRPTGRLDRSINDAGQRRPGYNALLDLVDQRVVVDVIAGASAGGINGGLLALAVARGLASVQDVRRIWIDKGDIATLMRPANTKAAPSLLRGDFFRDEMQAAFTEVAASTGGYDPAEVSVRFTGSLHHGVTRRYADDWGTHIIDKDYRLLFNFDQTDLHGRNPKIAELAVAARSTASFPVAFEPSWVPLNGNHPTLPDMSDHISPAPPDNADGLFVIDGGALNNQPFDETLRDVFARPASGAVRRVMLLVVPDPSEDVTSGDAAPSGTPAHHDQPPSLGEVLLNAASAMPRNQSLRTEFEALERHNRHADAFTTSRWDLAREVDIVATARGFITAYKAKHSTDAGIRTARSLLEILERSGQRDELELRYTEGDVARALSAARRNHYPEPFLPDWPVSTHGESDDSGQGPYWGYGITSAQRAAAAALDLGQSLLAAIPNRDAMPKPIRDAYREICSALATSHDHLKLILETKTNPDWKREQAEALLITDDLGSWAEQYFRTWRSTAALSDESDKRTQFQAVGNAALASARQLVELRRPVHEITEWFGSTAANAEHITTAGLAELKRLDGALTRLTRLPENSIEDPGEFVLRQLLGVELIFSSVTTDLVVPQRVELAQLSSYAPAAVGDVTTPRTPAEKLTGVELAHFAAFYRRSWRANDFMWGRLDAAARLTRIVLDINTLRQQWMHGSANVSRRAQLIAAIEKAATECTANGQPVPAVTEALREEWIAFAATSDFIVEIDAILTDPSRSGAGAVDGALPAQRLEKITERIVRRRQVEILIEELPQVAKELRHDQRDGVQLTAAAEGFLDQAKLTFETPDQLTLDNVFAAFNSCKVGREPEERTSDRLSSVIGQATAVGTTTLRTAVPLKSVRTVLSAVRGVGLTTLILSRLAHAEKRGSEVARLASYVMLAAGGAALWGTLFFDTGGIVLSAIGLGLIAAPLLLAAVRARALWVGVKLVATITATVAIWNIDWFIDQFDLTHSWWGKLADERETATLLVAIVGMFFVGRVSTLRGFVGRSSAAMRRGDTR